MNPEDRDRERPPEDPSPEGGATPSGGRGMLDAFRKGGTFARLGEEIKERAVRTKDHAQDWVDSFKEKVTDFGEYLHNQFVPELKAVVRKDPGSEELQREYNQIPQSIQNILTEVIPDGLLPKQVPYITALVEVSLGKDDSRAGDMEDILRGVYKLYDLHVLNSELGKRILKKIHEAIERKGFKDSIEADLIERVEIVIGLRSADGDAVVTLEPREPSKAIEALKNKLKLARVEIGDAENRIHLSDEEITRIDEEVSANDRLSLEQKAQLKAELKEQQLQKLKNILSLRSLPEDYDANFEEQHAELLDRIAHLERNGNLSAADANKLRRDIHEYYEGVSTLDLQLERVASKGSRGSIVEQAYQARLEITERQLKLLTALSNIKSLASYFHEHYGLGNGRDIQECYEMFNAEVRDLVEELFSGSLDSDPGTLFRENFDPIHEGRFYKSLVTKLKDLAEEISGYRENDAQILGLKNTRIKIQTVVMLPSDDLAKQESSRRFGGEAEQGITVGGKEEYAHIATQYLTFSSAMVNDLQRKIINLKDVTEYFHNAEVISHLGLGFDQMSKFAEKLSTVDLDEMWTQDPDIALAYQLYIKSLHDWLAQRNRHVVNSFGHIDRATNLDQIQKQAFLQFCAIKGIDPSEINRSPDKNLEKEFRKIKRKVRMASGIAKGGTAEFWDAMLTSRMLMTYEQKDPSDPERNPEQDTEYATAENYTGSHHIGYEKMIAGLDLDMILERFGVPSHWKDFRYLYIPRDLEKAPGSWSEMWNHNEVYKWRPKLENARYRGRTDEVAEFDEKYITMSENLKTRCLDLMRRGSWRYKQYNINVIREDGKVQYGRTIEKMRRLGFYGIQRFINEYYTNGAVLDALPQQAAYQQADIREFLGRGMTDGGRISSFADFAKEFKLKLKREKALNESFSRKKSLSGGQQKEMDEIQEFKEKMRRLMYEIEIFDRMEDIFPSHLVSTERRRYTPDTERTLFEEINEYLNTQFNQGYSRAFIEGQIYPLFLNSVQVVERIRWEEAKKSGDINYRLGIEDFLRPDIRKKLENHLSFYKGSSPIIHDPVNEGNTWSLEDLSFEDYEGMLHSFFKRLRGHYDDTYDRGADQRDPHRGGLDLRHRRDTNYGIAKRRYSRNHGGQEETLSQRLSYMLDTNIGELYHDIGGSDFDYSAFLLEQGGIRAHARMMGEVNNITTEMNPALVELVNEHFADFALADISTKEKLESAVSSHLSEPLKKIQHAIRDMDQNQADLFCIKMMAFIERGFVKDRKYRIKFFGDVLEKMTRDASGSQSTLMGDHFITLLERNANRLDSDDWLVVYSTLCNDLHLNLAEWSPHGSYETELQKLLKGVDKKYKIGETLDNLPLGVGKLVRNPFTRSLAAGILDEKQKFKRNHVYAGLIEKTTGLDMKTRILETFSPIVTIAIIILILALMKSAFDKEQEDSK